jgi:diguanylate cyclase (GGDEF)-like protein
VRKILLLLFIPFSLFSQSINFPEGNEYYFDKLTREDGLSHPSIAAIIQDNDGFLWIGTQDGLNRYDGREFLTFQHKPFDETGLPNNQIQTLFMGQNETIWIGTYGGLSRFHIPTLTFTNYTNDPEDPTSLIGSVVTAITESEEGLWVGTLGGLCLLDEEKGTFTRFNHLDENHASLPDNNIRSLFYDDENRLWIGTNKGLSLYRGEGKFISWSLGQEGPETSSSKAVMSIKMTDSGELALGLWNGGAIIFDRKKRSVVERFILEDNRVYFVYPDGRNMWVGTWGGGLYRINRDTNICYHQKTKEEKGAFDATILYSFYKDKKGIYWIGTKNNGLYKLNPEKRRALVYNYSYDNPHSLGKGEITEMLFDKEEKIWVGTYSNGLYKQNGPGNSFIRYGKDEPFPYTLSVDRVSMLYRDKNDRIWMGSTEGLFLYNDKKRAFEKILYDDRLTMEDQDIVYSMAEDNQGNYWIGTYNRGIIVRNKEWENPRYFNNSPEGGLSDNLIADIICDSTGDLWMATNSGVNRYISEKDIFVHYRYDRSASWGMNTDHIRHIFEDSHNRLWVGTSEGGINLLKREIGTLKDTDDPADEEWIKYTRKDGLPHNRIMKIQEDGRGNLWISTAFGLALYSREESIFTTIPQNEGLFSPEFSRGATVDNLGNLYFGSSDGVNRFTEENLYSNHNEPRIVLTDVQVFRHSLFPDGTIYNNMNLSFNSDERSLEIHYSALDLISSGNNRFAYKLEGHDSEWNYVGDKTEVIYNNLPSGQYTFRVKGSNNGGIWSSQEAVLHWTIKQPPWLSVWAILLYISGGLTFVGFLFVSVQHRLSLHKIKELEEVKGQLEEANYQLLVLSGQDGLTGVNNRRQFDEIINELWDVSFRTKQPLSFLMMDIDYFKSYNDTYGHQQGDSCLITLSRLFQEALPRSTDRVFRYGGEEFCLLLPSTNAEGALFVANRIHETIRKSQIAHKASPLSPYVTISIGIAVSRPDDNKEDLKAFINRGDSNCYKAKESGRNQTCLDGKSY